MRLCSLKEGTRSNERVNAFERKGERVPTRRRARSNKKTHAFEREGERVRTRRRTRSNERVNALDNEVACLVIRMFLGGAVILTS